MEKLPDRTIQIPEERFREILKKYFESDEIKRFGKIPLWIFIVLLSEIITMAFFGAEPFVHYKMHIIFATVCLIWFVWDTLRSMRIRQQAIAEIMIEFLSYQKHLKNNDEAMCKIVTPFDFSKKSEDL